MVGECGQTKVTKAKGTKKVPWYWAEVHQKEFNDVKASIAKEVVLVSWYWAEVHQKAFNDVKATIAKEVVLAYPDFDKVFEIYTDASTKQLGLVIT